MKTTQTELQKMLMLLREQRARAETNPITVGNGNEIYARGVAP